MCGIVRHYVVHDSRSYTLMLCVELSDTVLCVIGDFVHAYHAVLHRQPQGNITSAMFAVCSEIVRHGVVCNR